MPVDAPIACTLSEADLPQRLAAARTLGADALTGVEASGCHARLRFNGERERLEKLVAAETQCCSFLEFELEQSDEVIELTIHAPEGAGPVLQSLVAAIVAGWEGGL